MGRSMLLRAGRRRRSHFKAMDLSPTAKAIVRDGFVKDRTLDDIIVQVKKDTGQRIARSSLQRYREYWHATERVVIEAHQKAEELMRAHREHPTAELDTILQDTVTAITLNGLIEAKHVDPLDVGFLGVKQKQVALQERKLAIEERRVTVLEKKLKQMTDAAERARKTIDRAAKKKTLSADDIKTIREQVYGIA